MPSGYDRSLFHHEYKENVSNTVLRSANHNTSGSAQHMKLMGIQIENMDLSNAVYLRIWDVAATTDVTLASTANSFSVRVPAGGSFIDRADIPIKYFKNGICYAVTTERAGGGTAPGTAATVSLWSITEA